jgi:uncharacterized protein YbjT (DUF2867 family)
VSVVLVTGGSGVLGSRIVEQLRERGDEVRVLSRRDGAGTHIGDLSTGAGISEAGRGAELVIHAASDNKRNGRTDVEQTSRLLAATAGARHLLYISIVGIDQIPYSYYKRKLACEQKIASSGVPYTILRATQFHELIAFLLRGAERLPLAPLPLDFRFQPCAPAEVAERAAGLIREQPSGRLVNFGGPEILTLEQMAKVWKAARGRPRRTVRVPVPGKVGRGFRQGRNTCPDQAEGRLTWAEFVDGGPAVPYRLR